ncbi:hypothetical protein FKM82_015492 [Ascaphus truei]|uniref:histamine N-methyltransferase-like n=1 Tax=Ascaphus truei TaxID=8439 RepID=UPI003F5A9C8E
MAATMRPLLFDTIRYVESLNLSKKYSPEYENMTMFFDTKLPDILSGIGNGKSINVLGVGSGSGEMDLHIVLKIQAKYPDVPINNEVIEPSSEQLEIYKELLSNTLNLGNITFAWHQKTSSEYEHEVNGEKEIKKFDLIHMIQMIYFVKDVPATIEFFRSCLAPNGKLMIIVLSRTSGWNILFKKHGSRLPTSEMCFDLCSEDVTNVLDSMPVKYATYDLPTDLDITECFTEGNMNGELLLDQVTETCYFSKTAPPDLKELIMEDLKSPELSVKKNGKIFLNTDLEVIVVENQ